MYNTWTHIACTWDRATAKARVYQNGLLVDEAKVATVENLPNAGRQVFDVGYERNLKERVLNGSLSQLAVFDRALTGDEIMSIKSTLILHCGQTTTHAQKNK